MSVVDQLKNLFSKKPQESELDSRLSLAMPDATVDAVGHETVQESQNAPLQAQAQATPDAVDEAPTSNEGDLVSVPGLGRRTVSQHQRTLSFLLGGALLVLAVVVFIVLSQSDRVAQQLGATGQSLMQSQRLAKSVSQAVVGSAQAFPDVSESAGILAKSARGLQAGDNEMRITHWTKSTRRNWAR